MNKLVFVNRYYRPDHSATAQLLTDLAERLAERGESVVIVTSRQSYGNPQESLPPRACLAGVEVHRIWTSNFGRDRLVGRALDYLSFYISSLIILLKIVKPGDILVAKTDPPMISVIGALVVTLKRAALINWLQDLFPEVALELGVRIMRPPLYNLLKSLRNWSLRRAKWNVVLGNSMAKKLISEIESPDKTIVIPNWVIPSNLMPINHADNNLRASWDLGKKFVVGYSGNLGRAHDFETILNAALSLKLDPNIHFLFIGSGAQLKPVKEFVAQHLLDNVSFQPYQSIEQLAFSLSAPDVHLVSLRPGLEGLIVPSKFYGIIAVGRPVIFIGATDGELAQLIDKYNCGTCISPGDSASLEQYIIKLQSDTQLKNHTGSNSRALCDSQLNPKISIDSWLKALTHG